MEWQAVFPEKEGWYFVSYKGLASGFRRTETLYVCRPPKGLFLEHVGVKWATRQVNRFGPEKYDYFEMRFHPKCKPVFWLGPIDLPKTPKETPDDN